jgi:hypothetical protein
MLSSGGFQATHDRLVDRGHLYHILVLVTEKLKIAQNAKHNSL